jgi:hypothetical protein
MLPSFSRRTLEHLFLYFLGPDWKDKYDCIGLGVRSADPSLNWFNDEAAWWSKKTNEVKTFNWNADPSLFAEAGKEIAILRTGVHFFKLSYHHIGNDRKRYHALRPNNPAEQLPCWRKAIKSGKLYESMGTAINIHAGGDRTTGSRGCQTVPRNQYGGFINFVANALGETVKLGIVKALAKFRKGVGNIPYILLTQAQYDYLKALDVADFDSVDDLRYQMANFCTMPKVDHFRPESIAPDSRASLAGAGAVVEEMENEDHELNPADGELDESLTTFEGAPEIEEDNDLGGETTEQAGEKTETISEDLGGGVKKETSETTFQQKEIPVFLPTLGKLRWLTAIPGGTALLTAFSWFGNQPPHIQIMLGVGTFVTAAFVIYMFVAHRQKVLDIVAMCQRSWERADTHNLIPTPMPAKVGNGERRALLRAALATVQSTQGEQNATT